MKFLPLFFSFLLFVAFSACKNDSKPTNTESKPSAATLENCKYGVKADEVNVGWTAYKTTKRVGVKGTFTDVQIKTANNTPDISTLVRATAFMINTKTVDSKKAPRDAKLVTFFFEKMAGDMAITGSVKAVDGNNEMGTGVLAIKMNGVSKDAPFTYKISDKTLNLKSVINTDIWAGQSAMTSLHAACEKLHTGEDGVSKTWPDVAIEVSIPLVVTCD